MNYRAVREVLNWLHWREQHEYPQLSVPLIERREEPAKLEIKGVVAINNTLMSEDYARQLLLRSWPGVAANS